MTTDKTGAAWCWVPREATDAMLSKADSAIPRFEADGNGRRLMGVDGAKDAWDAMLAARPRFEPSREMVERVARAMMARHWTIVTNWREFEAHAIAAIAAMMSEG